MNGEKVNSSSRIRQNVFIQYLLYLVTWLYLWQNSDLTGFWLLVFYLVRLGRNESFGDLEPNKLLLCMKKNI